MDRFTVLSPLVTRINGMNPGPFTLTGSATYLIGSGTKRILFDTGEGKDEYIDNLKDAMAAVGCHTIEMIIVSHWHYDHLGGVPSVQKFLKTIQGTTAPVYKFIPEEIELPFGGEGQKSPYEIWEKDKFTPISDGQTLKTEGATLQLFHTPGHANDHVVAFLLEEKTLFSADNVLGIGTAVFRELVPYMESLERMKTLQPVRLLPGHGPVIEDGVERIDMYLKHRQKRIDQVLEVLSAELNSGRQEPLATDAITKVIYPENLSPELFLPAVGNTLNVLVYLEKKGFIESYPRDNKPLSRSHAWRRRNTPKF